VPPLQAATEAMMAKVNEMAGNPHIVFVMVAADVTDPEKLDNVRMVANIHPKEALELLGFIVEGRLRQCAPAVRVAIPGEPKH
jgi:hypothetical protein